MDYFTFHYFLIGLLRISGVIGVIITIIFVHEMGHYLVARWCGIKASVFSLGFGPELYSFRDKNKTLWRIALVPLGGYVRFLGDEDDIIEQNSLPEDEQFYFKNASAFKKALTVFAGPLFNAIFSFLILSFLLFSFGRVIVEPVIGEVLPNMPAQEAQLQKNDRILEIDGAKIESFDDLIQHIALNSNAKLNFKIQRDKAVFDVFITPKAVKRRVSFGKESDIGTIGIVAPKDPLHKGSVDTKFITLKNYTLLESAEQAFKKLYYIAAQTFQVLGRLIIGHGDRCQLSGPSNTAHVAWQISAFGFTSLLSFAALLSWGIGLINLLPIPPLDGGHLFFYLWEVIFRRPVNDFLKEWVFKLGMLIVLGFMLFSVVNDFIAC